MHARLKLPRLWRPNNLIKILSCAAVFWIFFADDGSSAMYIHKCFSHEIWQESRLGTRLGLGAAMLVWPAVTLGAMGFYTARSGPGIRTRIGKSLARQMYEQIRLALTWCIPPAWYYIFELHDETRRRGAGHYIYRFETKPFLYDFLRRYPGYPPTHRPRSIEYLRDKDLFTLHCRLHGLPAVATIARVENGEITPLQDTARLPSDFRLPSADLFVKPRNGAGGRGAVLWRYVDGGRYRNQYGRVITAAALETELKARSHRTALVIRLRAANHPQLAPLSPDALATVRLLTCRNERGEFEVTNALLRMGRRNAIVDNMHAGGMGARIDIDTGRLGNATAGAWGLGPGLRWWDAHPDTGAHILGRQLPFWPQVLDLGRSAHTLFPDQVAIGWDIAILADGPCLVEGNKSPDLDIVQRTHRAPLGNARFGELLAFNLKRALAAR